MIRPYLLARREGLPGTAAFATIILERLLDLVTVLLLFAFFVLTADPASMSAAPAAMERVKLGGLIAAAGGAAALAVAFVAAGHPERLGRWALRVERVLPAKLARIVASFVETFTQGLAVMRQPRRLLVSFALSIPLWMSIAAGIWLTSLAFHITFPYVGSFLVMTILVVGVAMPTPGRGRRVPRGVPDCRPVLLRRPGRPRHRRGDRAARRVVRPGDAARPRVHGPRRHEPVARTGARRRVEAGLMKCPYCAHLGDKVVDSRESKEGEVIRRRRECLGCGRRFTSYERIDEIPYMVIKKDGSRERFERQKLLAGLLKACEKRPVSVASLEAVADRVESALQDKPEREMSTEEVGAFVMNELRHLDKVAYVRFASVYRHFRDIGEFMTELKDLLNAKE